MQPFYKEDFDEDEERVNALFEGADEEGISIEKRVLTREEIIKFLRGGYVLVMLVNSLHLPRTWRKRSKEETAENRKSSSFWTLMSQIGSATTTLFASAAAATGSYVGHFILVLDYLEGADCFTYRDPAEYDSEEQSPNSCYCQANLILFSFFLFPPQKQLMTVQHQTT